MVTGKSDKAQVTKKPVVRHHISYVVQSYRLVQPFPLYASTAATYGQQPKIMNALRSQSKIPLKITNIHCFHSCHPYSSPLHPHDKRKRKKKQTRKQTIKPLDLTNKKWKVRVSGDDESFSKDRYSGDPESHGPPCCSPE